jgi:hypothetical protein
MENHKGTVTARRQGDGEIRRLGEFHRVTQPPYLRAIFKPREN